MWKRKKITNFRAKKLKEQIFKDGKLVYELPDIETIRKHCSEQVDALWPEILRFENPQNYFVDLSHKLWELKNQLLEEHSEE